MRQVIALTILLATVNWALADAPAPPATSLAPSNSRDVTHGCELARSGEAEQALSLLGPIVDFTSTEMTARACYATALSLAGDYERARQQVSVVLSWNPAWPDGYVVRAVSAAEMGSVHQASQDLELARRLDPQDHTKSIAPAAARIEKALSSAPTERADRLYGDLLQDARKGLPMDQLAGQASALLKASNRERRLGDERYAEARRELTWALMAQPRNADRLAALGQFLLDEVDVRGDSVEPTQSTIPYRQQDKSLKAAELREARRLFNDALAVKPDHVPSLIGLARMEARESLWANAERYLRRALATGGMDRDVLKLMRDVMRAAAAQRAAGSVSLRMSYHWEDKLGNTLYEYTAMPSAEDLAKANDYDAQAARLLVTAKDYIRRALNTLSDDAAGHDFVGSMAFAAKDWKAAARAWEKAVRFDPATRQYRYSLANAYSELGDLEAYMQQATAGRNLEHTTPATQLERAWDLIANGGFTKALDFLDQAVTVDPGDARIPAYMAVAAEGQGNRVEALALYRAAFALEEAHANQRGGSWIQGNGRWYVRDTGLATELRSRIADLIRGQQPLQAAGLYLQNVAIESWFRGEALKERVDSAMLPLPNLPAGMRQVAPTFGELMRTNRALAAAELASLGQCETAAPHFKKLLEYDGRDESGGTNAYQRPRDGLWKTRRIVAAAVDCFERVNDQQQLYRWRSLSNRAPADQDARRFSPTETGTGGKFGWRRY